jgi:hypothetical protein
MRNPPGLARWALGVGTGADDLLYAYGRRRGDPAPGAAAWESGPIVRGGAGGAVEEKAAQRGGEEEAAR